MAKKYNCHHSTIAYVKQETDEVMETYWDEKSQRLGRPEKNVPDNANLQKIECLTKKVEELKIEMQLKEDFLKLQIKLAEEKKQG